VRFVKNIWNRLFARHFHHIIVIKDNEVSYWMDGEMHSYDTSTFIFSQLNTGDHKYEAIDNYKRWFDSLEGTIQHQPPTESENRE